MSAVNENLKYLRQAKGLTQAMVADAIGVTRQTISSYESGRTQPDLEILKSLAEVYQADIYDILYGGNRLQKRLKFLYRTAYLLTAVLLIGLLVHSALLWTVNTYFAVTPGMITESNHQIINMRFSLLNTSEAIINISSTVFNFGCIILLFICISTDYSVAFRTKLLWLLGMAATALIVTMPWAMFDNIYSYIDYLLPILKTMPTALLVFAILSVADFIRKSKKKKSNDGY